MQTINNLKRVKVSVNMREIEVYESLSILQALLQEDIHVPHLCYDIRINQPNGNCGLCVVELKDETGQREVKACHTPIKEGMVICTNSPQLESYRKIRLEQLLIDHNADCIAPCVLTCPAHIDIQAYLTEAANGNFETALRIIRDRIPFPLVCGHVCPHPCEAKCRRNLVDLPVAINNVKRFVADWDMAREQPWTPKKQPATGKRIAIVGAGPAGLTAAYYSAINGHDITVFEQNDHSGGMMQYGIPEYRLPKAMLDKEISIIKNLGVKIMTGKALGKNLQLATLKNDFDAVYIAIGSWQAKQLRIEGESLPGVITGIQYLKNQIEHIPTIGYDDVVIIGGGGTALDCARTALRTGSKNVKLICLESIEEMPAAPFEIEEALTEGVEILCSNAPTKITAAGDKKLLHYSRIIPSKPDSSGQCHYVPVQGSEIKMEADTIIVAIGQGTDTEFLSYDLPLELNKYGNIKVNEETAQTSEKKIFAGGDCVMGSRMVIHAIADGHRAADCMHDFLALGYVNRPSIEYCCSRGELEDLPKWEFDDMPKVDRGIMPSITIAERKNNFNEIELGYNEQTTIAEAARCLQCGCSERYNCDLRNEASAHKIEYRKPIHERPYVPIVYDHHFIVRDHNKCFSCGRCIDACAEIEGPDILTFYMKNGRQLIGTKSGLPLQNTDCVSCGQCVNACPCGSLIYTNEIGKVYKAINDPTKTVVAFVAPAVRSVITSHFGISFDEASAFMAGLLKKLGFDKFFDFSFAADLTIVEETTEFINRLNKNVLLPQFTSCCPGWVNFVERRYPELIPHLSSCKSPQMMMGATVTNHYTKLTGIDKKNLYIVSIVPCLAKKDEAARPEFAPDGIRDIDAVLTSIDMLEMFNQQRIDINEIITQEFDDPYKQVSGAGILFGASGGVAEAALRMAVEKLTGHVIADHLACSAIRGFRGVKEATIEAKGKKIRVAVISGLHNAEPIIEKTLQGVDVGYDLIEVMACPGGCISGAGHPVPEKVDEMEKRQTVLINIDKTSKYRKSQENPDILRLYKDYYGEADSPLAHKLLHTHYHKIGGDFSSDIVWKKADSAFVNYKFAVCTCDVCAGKGSKALYARIAYDIKQLKMDSFVEIRTIRLKENHPGTGIYITLNGKQIEEPFLTDIYQSIKQFNS